MGEDCGDLQQEVNLGQFKTILNWYKKNLKSAQVY